MTEVLIQDHTKFNNQIAKILLNVKEGIIVSVKEREEIPIFFGLFTGIVDREHEYFLYPFEYKVVSYVAEHRYNPTHIYLEDLDQTFKDAKKWVDEIKSNHYLESSYKPAVCPPPPKKYHCPRCKKMGTLREHDLTLTCCGIAHEMILGWDIMFK